MSAHEQARTGWSLYHQNADRVERLEGILGQLLDIPELVEQLEANHRRTLFEACTVLRRPMPDLTKK